MDFPYCSAPFSNSAVKGTELSDFFKFYEVPHDILANNRRLQLHVCKNNKVTDVVCSPWTSFLKQTNQGFKLEWSSIHLPIMAMIMLVRLRSKICLLVFYCMMK